MEKKSFFQMIDPILFSVMKNSEFLKINSDHSNSVFHGVCSRTPFPAKCLLLCKEQGPGQSKPDVVESKARNISISP